MTITTADPRSAAVPAVLHGSRATIRRTAWHVAGAIDSVRTHGTALVAQVPGVLRAARTGARGTISALQTLPDPALRWLAAGSAGFAAGLFLAGAPRLVTTVGIAPALAAGAAIALRPAAVNR